MLNAGEIFTSRRRLNAEDILHDEHPRLKELYVPEEFAVELSAIVVHEASRAVVCAITLARRREALARWTTGNDIYLFAANDFREVLRAKLREVFATGSIFAEIRKVFA